MNTHMIKTAALVFFVGIHSTAIAAVQGVAGSESQGSSSLNITIPVMRQLSGVMDYKFGDIGSATQQLSQDNNICVYTNDPSGSYNVTIQSLNKPTGDQFFMSGDRNPNEVIEYKVIFNDRPTPGNEFAKNGQVLSSRTGANIQEKNCNIGQKSANLKIIIPNNDLQNKSAQNYTDTISIIIH